MLILLKNILSILASLVLVLAFFSVSVADENNDQSTPAPQDGELVLPSDYNAGKEKKCLTVCEEWGEDCIINPATGSRKCRRVCKSFTEECF